MKNAQRPLPQGYENVGYANHFELRYLRWDYLIKTKNPDESVLKSKEAIIKYCARRAYTKYRHEFGFMSMDVEDIESIARVYAVSFLGLYSSKNNKKVESRHKKKLKKQKNGEVPTKEEMELKDNRSLIAFVNQRLMECAYVFRQKSKGLAGFNYYTVFVRKSGDEWPDDRSLMEKPGKFGWEKVSWSTFVKIRKFFSSVSPGYSVEIDGKVYRIASPETSLVYSSDNEGAENIIDSIPDRRITPEDLLIKFEEEKSIPVKDSGIIHMVPLKDRISNLVSLFKERGLDDQERILKRFVKWLKRRNGSQNEMAEEIRQVTQMLAKIKKKRDNPSDGTV